MRLTTKGRYAVAAVLDLALHSQRNAAVSLQDISGRQDIPVSYLGKLFVQLRQQGLVNSQRGPGGGYVLAKDPVSISLTDIIDAVGEQVDTVRCGGKSNCQNHQQCLTHSLWAELGNKIREVLASVSLEQMINNPNVLKVAERQDRASDPYQEPIISMNQNHSELSRSYS